jgi:YegS/Rv2252/BmrU family lipid kinase
MSSLAVLVANPAAGSFSVESLERLARQIRHRGLETEIFLSETKGGIQVLARKAAGMSPEVVFVFGGDGTFNEAANGLVHTGIPVSFIPAGTTNVLARELGIPGNFEDAIRRALERKAVSISLGKVTYGGGAERYFIMMAGAGFDAYSVYRVNPAVKARWGKGAYLLSGMGALLRYNPPPIEVIAGERRSLGYVVITGNGSRYGGKYRITRDASLFEPCLSVFILKNNTRFSLLRTAYRIIRGKRLNAKEHEFFRTEHLSLLGSSHVQVDGDYLGMLPAEISVERECLSVRY